MKKKLTPKMRVLARYPHAISKQWAGAVPNQAHTNKDGVYWAIERSKYLLGDVALGLGKTPSLAWKNAVSRLK